jgi:protein involved in polysaccharide export with SLBB domain
MRKMNIGHTGCVSLLALGLAMMAHPCDAQSVPNPASTQADSGTAGGGAAIDSQNSTTGDLNQRERQPEATDAVMPAADLIRLLQRDPDAMVEVKSLIADTMQQQDMPVDSITDDQVYTRIESSRELRKTLTQFLRARGYLTEEQIAAAKSRDSDLLTPDVRGAGEESDLADLTNEDLSTLGYDSRRSDGSQLETFSKRNGLRASTADRSGRTSRAVTSEPEPNVTDEPQVLRRPAPYNLRSLRDLYTQVPDASMHLKRFGSDVFTMHGSARRASLAPELDRGTGALDVPLGPDYVLGPGDELSISMWGGISESLRRQIDREGGIALPEAGVVQLAGMTLEKAQSVIQNALQSQYRNSHAVVTVARLRSIRIFVVGDVQRPGSYEVSSLASPVSALYAAGGPTAVGSLRILKHFRNEKQIGEIDLYDFMLHGIRSDEDRLQSGDTLLVPPVGPQVAVFGAVKRPAIYELRTENNLAQVLEDAGGMTVAAAMTHIAVERVVANQGRQEIGINSDVNEKPSVTREKLAGFEVKDGDRIHIATVLPVNDRVVYVQGHVARPGRIAYRDNMRLSDVLRSYGDLLPEPAERGEIIRLVAPDMHPETIDFNLQDVLIGNSSVTLQAFDTIRVFGRYEQDPPMVGVRGEVQRPGSYPMFEGMTAAELVRAAGGFKRDALLNRADLTTYNVVNGARVTVSRRDIAIGSAVLKGEGDADVQLKPGDVLTVHQLTGWDDIGASIMIDGEVGHPGSYGFQEGEHLSDVLKRAGGFRATAYPEGAVLIRPEVAALEDKSREELIRQIQTSSAAARMSPGIASSDASATLQVIQQQQDQVIAELKNTPAAGRLVIHISDDIASWAGTAADVEVRRGDELKIPKRPGFVLVSGQVYNASAITFTPNKTARWYLQRAGGATEIANRKDVFVIRANGEVIGRRSGTWHDKDVLSTKLDAGDTVVVPQKIIGASLVWRNLLATAQVAASVAIAAAVVGL